MTSAGRHWVVPGRVWDPWFGSPFFADIWDPFEIGLPDLWWEEVEGGGNARVDWRETDKAHIFRADLPGVRKEAVKVQVEDGNVLQISGQRNKDNQGTDDKWHRIDQGLGNFLRRFRLPGNANMDETKCGLENGVLTVTMPKKKMQETPKDTRNVNVGLV